LMFFYRIYQLRREYSQNHPYLLSQVYIKKTTKTIKGGHFL